ncbi:MAG: molybdopterin-synthase adenylyltransferase MoeB [Flavicella sp.]
MFTKEENTLYNRHFILDKIGKKGQLKLKKSKVLVIGAGGLGCPILQYLTAAGVGTIGLIDNDTVSRSNLQRQILYTTEDIGKLKTNCAVRRLQQLNPFVNFKTYKALLTVENAIELFSQYDIIVDGSDNFQTRYLSNDAAILTKKPLVYGAIYKFEGQVSVFNYNNGPSYRCLFPTPPSANSIPNCSDIGVLGVLPGIIGTLQANEVLKIICELNGILSGKLLTLNSLSLQQNILQFSKTKNANITKLLDNYAVFCGIETNSFHEISPKELKEELPTGNFTLLDVRKKIERETFHIGGLHIPLHQLQDQMALLKDIDTIIVYCQVGQRSRIATKILLEKYPNKIIKNLTGGITAWSKL